MKESKAAPIQELADAYKGQIIETTRKVIAVRERFDHYGGLVRFRRAAPTGPNRDTALIFILVPGREPDVLVVPYAQIEDWARGITDQQVFEHMLAHAQPNEQ